MTDEHSADSLILSTRDGVEVDIEPLVDAARTMRRKALQDAEQDPEMALARRDLTMVLFGMRIAVIELFGHEAGVAFTARLDAPARHSPDK